MDKPICRLCGARHYSHEAHKFKPAEKSPGPKKVLAKKSKKKKSSQVERNRKWRERNREKYNEAQRKLMRERRE